MRKQGVVASAAGLVPFGHLGWGFRDRTDFLARAAEYLADGLEQNQLMAYIGNKSREALQAELAEMPGIGDRPGSAGIQVIHVEEHYVFRPGSNVIDAERCVTKYLWCAEQAIANGYTGLRAVSDVTPVARTPEQRHALAALEYLVDQKMAVLPVSALCAYDTSELGPAAAELICLHPFAATNGSAFRLYAEPGLGFALTGEIDAASDELFITTLRRVWPLVTDDPLVIDVHRLEFISHQALLALDQHARAVGRRVVLRAGRGVPARLADLLDLTNVRVEPPVEDPDAPGAGSAPAP